MRKGLLASVITALITSLTGGVLLTPASAAIKAGTTCTKINQKTTSAGYTYTCIKSGKKLVWSKGVKVVAPKPTPSATPTPSPIPSAIGDPIGAIGSTPTPSATPTTPVTSLFPISSEIISPSNLHATINESGILLNWEYSALGKVKIEFHRIRGVCTKAKISCGSYQDDLWILPTSEKAIIAYQVKAADLGAQAIGGEWKFWVGANNQTLKLGSPDQGFDPLTFTIIASPSPSATPSATPMPSPTPAPTPTTAPTPIPLEPKTLDDLIAHPESVSYWAWKRSAQQIAASSEVGPKATLIVGPHTKLPNTYLQMAIDMDSKLYQGFAHPTSVTAIYYNILDIAWAQQEWAKIAKSPAGNEAARMCATSETCWGALAEIDLKGAGILLFATQDPLPANSSQASGTREAHEYAHTIQATQFVGTGKEASSTCCIKTYMPWWMVEGHAEFTQAVSTYSTSFETYLLERQSDTGDLLANTNKLFTQAWFQNYLDTSSTSQWIKSENSWRMYDVGYMVNEILTSLSGPAITMQLFKDVANGKTWEQAFESDFGMSWSVALPKISAVLYAMVGH